MERFLGIFFRKNLKAYTATTTAKDKEEAYKELRIEDQDKIDQKKVQLVVLTMKQASELVKSINTTTGYVKGLDLRSNVREKH